MLIIFLQRAHIHDQDGKRDSQLSLLQQQERLEQERQRLLSQLPSQVASTCPAVGCRTDSTYSGADDAFTQPE